MQVSWNKLNGSQHPHLNKVILWHVAPLLASRGRNPASHAKPLHAHLWPSVSVDPPRRTCRLTPVLKITMIRDTCSCLRTGSLCPSPLDRPVHRTSPSALGKRLKSHPLGSPASYPPISITVFFPPRWGRPPIFLAAPFLTSVPTWIPAHQWPPCCITFLASSSRPPGRPRPIRCRQQPLLMTQPAPPRFLCAAQRGPPFLSGCHKFLPLHLQIIQ